MLSGGRAMVMQARAQPQPAPRSFEAALDLFEDSGYGSTGLTDIINKAAVTKGAFYYHFHTKRIGRRRRRRGVVRGNPPDARHDHRGPAGPAPRKPDPGHFRGGRSHAPRPAGPGRPPPGLVVPAVRAVGSPVSPRADRSSSRPSNRRRRRRRARRRRSRRGGRQHPVGDGRRAIVFDAGAGDIYTGLRSSWRIILRGIASESSLAYFEEFVTRVAARYQSGVDQAR